MSRNYYGCVDSLTAYLLMSAIYDVSITIRIVHGFVLLALIWKYDFPPFMVLIIAILNYGTIMTISKDRVKPSPTPDSWKLNEIFATGIVIGTYLALISVLFYWAVTKTNFFEAKHRIRRRQELTQTTPDQLHWMMAMYYKVAGDCPKGCVYSLSNGSETELLYSVSDPLLIREGTEMELLFPVSVPSLNSNGSETEFLGFVSVPSLIRNGSETEYNNYVYDPSLIRNGSVCSVSN
ncbi:hypothetical protein Syun_014609 [Stephania yunnanensis]|uniref:Uncharacterized protein n=1 Tax=Stephania yunnanensis TaxID=152371 RepID=A0AAP0P9S4_9MAGN